MTPEYFMSLDELSYTLNFG